MKLENNKYNFGGADLQKLVEDFGTPLYVYDENTLIRQYKRLTSAFKGVKLKVKYACKALSNQAILKLFHKIGSGLDAVSIQEVQLGLKAGFSPEEILFTPNGVSFDEIKMGVDAGVVINIDNISILEHFGHEYGSRVPCCIRLNPHIMAGGHQHIQTGHIDSKFGISVHQLRHVERIIKTYNIHVTGLHVHTGSEILDSGVFLRAAELMFEAAHQFKDLLFIDFGSGFKVAYKDGGVLYQTLSTRHPIKIVQTEVT